VRRALEVPLEGHHRVLLCAADIAATEESLVMAGRFARSVPVRDTARFRIEPRRSLFDCSAAARVLGWEPRYQWSTRGQDQAS
jgi:nucleoside-diphosphate-sugar epimerase